jgi:hypothetical protein
MSQLRNQLKDITFDDITTDNIKTVGGRVYADSRSRTNVDDLVNIQNGWDAVHIPTKGRFIPGSGLFIVGVIDDSGAIMMNPSDSEVMKCDHIAVKNETLGSLTATAYIQDDAESTRLLIASQSVAAGATVVLTLGAPVIIDSGFQLFCIASGADLTFTVYRYKVVQ